MASFYDSVKRVISDLGDIGEARHVLKTATNFEVDATNFGIKKAAQETINIAHYFYMEDDL